MGVKSSGWKEDQSSGVLRATSLHRRQTCETGRILFPDPTRANICINISRGRRCAGRMGLSISRKAWWAGERRLSIFSNWICELRSAQGQINDGTYVANRLWVIDILRDLGPLPFYPPREGFCQLKQRRILVQTPMMTCPRRKLRRVELEGCAPYEYNDGGEKAQNHVGDHHEREKWAIRTPRAGWGSASACRKDSGISFR